MSARDEGETYRKYWCDHCQGFGHTVESKTVMGMRLFLEDGKAHRLDMRLDCPYCRGTGFDEEKLSGVKR